MRSGGSGERAREKTKTPVHHLQIRGHCIHNPVRHSKFGTHTPITIIFSPANPRKNWYPRECATGRELIGRCRASAVVLGRGGISAYRGSRRAIYRASPRGKVLFVFVRQARHLSATSKVGGSGPFALCGYLVIADNGGPRTWFSPLPLPRLRPLHRFSQEKRVSMVTRCV